MLPAETPLPGVTELVGVGFKGGILTSERGAIIKVESLRVKSRKLRLKGAFGSKLCGLGWGLWRLSMRHKPVCLLLGSIYFRLKNRFIFERIPAGPSVPGSKVSALAVSPCRLSTIT